MTSGTLRAIFFKEDDQWVAQCIEYDIGAQGASQREAEDRLKVAIATHIEESILRTGEAFKGIDPAPAHFHKLWDATEWKRSTTITRPSRPPVDVELALTA